MLARLLVLAALVAPAGGAPARAAADERLDRERTELLARGEAALARIDVGGALRAFERAASILHAADAEMGLVRAYMQGGEYRRAVAFVAHTAAAHRDVAGAAALHAWLLHLGGHGVQAQRILIEAEERFEADPILSEVRRQLASRRPLATGPLLDAPARLAPYAATTLPRGARVAGSGWVFDGGRRALVPTSTLRGHSAVWVRNGLGEVARARVEKREPRTGLAVLRLETALPLDSRAVVAPRDPYPGSVAFAVEYVESRDAAAQWPVLHSGFLGQPIADGAERKLGLDMPPGPRGGPVFDAGGRFVGIALAGDRGAARLLPPSRLELAVGEGALGATGSPSAPRVSADVIYESALRCTAQVIVAR